MRISTSSSDVCSSDRPKTVLARFGALHPATLKAFDIDGPVMAVEIFLDAIPPRRGNAFARPAYAPPALQSVKRDFAFLVPADLPAAHLQLGRASWRGGVCSDVCIGGVAQPLTK